jgi:hypothetical protein
MVVCGKNKAHRGSFLKALEPEYQVTRERAENSALSRVLFRFWERIGC